MARATRTHQPFTMKVVGRRRWDRGGWEEAAGLLRTAAALRGHSALVPRGIYRFPTFEEAEAWMVRMMARTHASLRSRTSSGSAGP